MDSGAWKATVYGVAKSDMTENTNTHTHIYHPQAISRSRNMQKVSKPKVVSAIYSTEVEILKYTIKMYL